MDISRIENVDMVGLGHDDVPTPKVVVKVVSLLSLFDVDASFSSIEPSGSLVGSVETNFDLLCLCWL